jgi:predicted alpha/beta-hydrolase family hydrolase
MAQLWLAHGAWGSAATVAPWIEGLRALGLDANAVTLPRGRAERGIGSFAAQVPDAPGVIVGGQSLGGRVATLLAAREPGVLEPPLAPAREHALAGVVALAFPLHRPRIPDATLARAAHFPSIAVPALFLSGDVDPYARLDLLRAAVARLPRAELVVYPGAGHDLSPVRDDVLERIAAFTRSLGVAAPEAS